MVTTDIAILTPKPLASSSGLDGTDHHIDWHPRPDWVALSSDRLALESGTIYNNRPDTTVGTDGNLGTKKMGLVGEFKFFSEFGWAETGATD